MGKEKRRIIMKFVFLTVVVLFLSQCGIEDSSVGLPRHKVITIREDQFKEVRIEKEIERGEFIYSYLEEPAWEKNEGQIPNPDIKYYAHVSWGYVGVTEDAIWYYLFRRSEGPSDFLDAYVIKETFAESFTFTFTPSEEVDEGKINYFFGDEPSRWVIGVRRYRKLSLGEIYPGVELELEIRNGDFVKMFHVNKVGSLANVKLIFTPKNIWPFDIPTFTVVLNGNLTEELRCVDNGGFYSISLPNARKETFIVESEVSVKADIGDFLVTKPDIQVTPDNVFVAGVQPMPKLWENLEPGSYAGNYERVIEDIVFISKFDRELRLVSKAYLYPGGSSSFVKLYAYPKEGVYLAGVTSGFHLPGRSNGLQKGMAGGRDGFVVLFDMNLRKVKSATYLGGEGYDWLDYIVVNSSGVYLAGRLAKRPSLLKEGLAVDSYESGLLYVVLLGHDLRHLKGSFTVGFLSVSELLDFEVSESAVYLWVEGFLLDLKMINKNIKGLMSLKSRYRGKRLSFLFSISSDLQRVFRGRTITLGGRVIEGKILKRKHGVRLSIARILNYGKSMIVLPRERYGLGEWRVSSGQSNIILCDLDYFLKLKGFLVLSEGEKIPEWGRLLLSPRALLLSRERRGEIELLVLDFIRGGELTLLRYKCGCSKSCSCKFNYIESNVLLNNVLDILVYKEVDSGGGLQVLSIPLDDLENASSSPVIARKINHVSCYEGSGRDIYIVAFDSTSDYFSFRGAYGCRFVRGYQPMLIKYSFDR